ncbi:hypothetical protein PRZ61_03740 [Halomonas pacifica]|nr:hypothetical protein [Halomonas pacifica]
MSYGVAVNQLDAAGGAQVWQSQSFFRVEGEPVVRIGDQVESHGPPPHSPPPAMVEGSGWYRVAGIAVSRQGHRASCGHATTGRPWYRLSE